MAFRLSLYVSEDLRWLTHVLDVHQDEKPSIDAKLQDSLTLEVYSRIIIKASELCAISGARKLNVKRITSHSVISGPVYQRQRLAKNLQWRFLRVYKEILAPLFIETDHAVILAKPPRGESFHLKLLDFL